MPSTILITQGSSMQSQRAMKHLLKAGHNLHVLVRDTSKTSPLIDAHRQQITLFQGTHSNYDDVLPAAKGCSSVFLTTFPWQPGMIGEQARATTKACLEAGVSSIVNTSVALAGDEAARSGHAAQESKLAGYFSWMADAEEVVRTAGFKSWTILRPNYLSTNFTPHHVKGNFPELPTEGLLMHSFEEGATITITDSEDIGIYVAAALQDPEKFAGKEIEMGTESLGIEQIADIIRRVSGKKNIRVEKAVVDAPIQRGVGPAFQYFFSLLGQEKVSALVRKSAEQAAEFGLKPSTLEEALSTTDREGIMEVLANVQ